MKHEKFVIMNNFSDNSQYRPVAEIAARTTDSMLRKVYFWMCGALAITGLTAYYVASSQELLQLILGSRSSLFLLIIIELGLVIGLSAAIGRMSATTATLMFILYSVVNGATLSVIFLAYSTTAIATTFFVTAGTFAAMAVYGAVTKKDLTRMGSLLVMALLGLIIAMVVNIFLKSDTMSFMISCVGVVIFVGLTAYDSQKIKALLGGAEENEMTQKIAVLGALTLYLDFINLFLNLLRIFGSRR